MILPDLPVQNPPAFRPGDETSAAQRALGLAKTPPQTCRSDDLTAIAMFVLMGAVLMKPGLTELMLDAFIKRQRLLGIAYAGIARCAKTLREMAVGALSFMAIMIFFYFLYLFPQIVTWLCEDDGCKVSAASSASSV